VSAKLLHWGANKTRKAKSTAEGTNMYKKSLACLYTAQKKGACLPIYAMFMSHMQRFDNNHRASFSLNKLND
jgi:hypothetical protein